ncbi:MAG TPA: response regulator [Elusimicrobiota bacterium]|nr:response regulator [Elusimicrobiota bacterium]
MGDGKKRILVVDDEPFLLDLMLERCDEIGVTAIPAENGAEGLQKAASEKPDAIIVDNRMPGMSGMEVIAKLKSDPATQDIPVMLLSADSKQLHEAEAKKLGAYGVLMKPVKMADLKAILEGCLGGF